MKIYSKVKHSRVIPIVLANGKQDTINLQGKGRVELPLGACLDPRHEHALRPTLLIEGEPSGAGSTSAPGSQVQLPVKSGSPLVESSRAPAKTK